MRLLWLLRTGRDGGSGEGGSKEKLHMLKYIELCPNTITRREGKRYEMEKQKTVFTFLGITALILLIVYVALIIYSNQNCTNFVTGEPCADLSSIIPGIAIMGTISLGFFLLAWRNDAGIREAKRHKETLQVTRQKQQAPTISDDDVILRKAATLWNQGHQQKAIQLLEALPDNPKAQRILAKAKQQQQ